METSRSFAFLSGIGAIAVALLELLLFLPDSSAGIYLQTILGVSNITLVQWLLLALIVILSAYPAYAIWSIVSKERRKFDAEIVGKKRLILGETVRFKAYYRGKLSRGFFTCKVTMPDRPPEFWPAPDTYQTSKEGDVGVLSGKELHEAEWGFHIPTNYPVGGYVARIGVWDAKDSRAGNSPVREKSVSFLVLSPGSLGTFGTSTFAASGVTWVDSSTLSSDGTTPETILDVNWHLSGDIQPHPFGKHDIRGSDRASKLQFSQCGKNITLIGEMHGLKASRMYHVQIGQPYTAGILVMDSIIGVNKAPYLAFKTDEKGDYTWQLPVTVDHLIRNGIVDRFAVWVNDAFVNASVLGSDNIAFDV